MRPRRRKCQKPEARSHQPSAITDHSARSGVGAYVHKLVSFDVPYGDIFGPCHLQSSIFNLHPLQSSSSRRSGSGSGRAIEATGNRRTNTARGALVDILRSSSDPAPGLGGQQLATSYLHRSNNDEKAESVHLHQRKKDNCGASHLSIDRSVFNSCCERSFDANNRHTEHSSGRRSWLGD